MLVNANSTMERGRDREHCCGGLLPHLGSCPRDRHEHGRALLLLNIKH
jgi:hypothetical protein